MRTLGQPRTRRIAVTIVLVAAVLLRVGLALVNREANDNHLKPVGVIINAHRLPDMSECRECSHPKLWYVTAAALFEGFGVRDAAARIVLLQLLNVLAGVLTLAVIARFIREYPSDNERLKVLAFALIALNPKLIAINAQATNDSFAILFATLALFFTYRCLERPGIRSFGLLVLFICLAVSAKVTGWVACAGMVLGFLSSVLAGAEPRGRRRIYAFALPFAVIVLTILNPLSQVVTNTQKFGAPIVTRDKRLPLPHVFKRTVYYPGFSFRPGIVSIQDGFFTFKMADLLEYPLITNGPFDYPPHRTSFWTVLYGDAHSLHFQNWPVSWQTEGDDGFFVSREIFILALAPTLMFVYGGLAGAITLLRSLAARTRLAFQAPGDVFLLVTAAGHVAFLVLAALLYREFSFFKLIYVLPGLLSFTWVLLRGAEAVFRQAARVRWGVPLLSGWLMLLLGFYVWDVMAMTFQLYRANIHG